MTSTDTGVHNIRTLSAVNPLGYYALTPSNSFSASEADLSPCYSKAEFDTALAENRLMVLDCMATWCGPCKVIAPHIVKMSSTYSSARFFKLDVDEVPDVAQELGVRAMPTFIVFKNGEKVGEVVGANPKALEALVERETSDGA